MDNAGGHGTDKVKKQYVQLLKDKYNIIVVWQCPNSPETNLLDLGIWMSLQSLVKKIHKCRRVHPNVLAYTVKESFNKFESTTKFSNIWNRWQKVLELIVVGNGGNDLCEMNRGKNGDNKPLPEIKHYKYNKYKRH